ncbi:sulfite exporter TauE/SafE family protein [Amaricoccus tamworthensis]|uniref:sulfite exporter TauE/SafE family protein n=1 Tax=Amaricoccus tamworthensis TaxID=57002 RepID=UPI003C7D36D5
MEIQVILALAAVLLAAGAVVGVLAGLFGVGGGAISVPVLYETFGIMGVSEDIAMPMAVGTSLCIIIPTSIQSARGHFLHGAVDMNLLRTWAFPVLAGVLIGAVIAKFANPWVFQLAFVLVATTTATRLLLGGKNWRVAESLPARSVLSVYGAIVGFLSSLMGIGGGALSNLILSLHGYPIHRAIATSAGVGVLISIPGTIGYMIAGWGKPGLPPDALGFISLLGFIFLVPTSLLTARIGVRFAHSLSKRRLEMLFGGFLLLVSLRFAFELAGF